MQSLLDTFPHERFWTKVIRTDLPHNPDGCWLWTGGQIGSGGIMYGGFMHQGLRMGTHRWSWALANGPIPDGMIVCHRCDTPLCVRPDHLFVGTHSDNTNDMLRKGRRPQLRKGFKLNPDLVREIRRRYAEGIYQYENLAADYGVMPSTIRSVVQRRIWKHVTDTE